MQIPQLVGVLHQIDGHDLSVVDLERGRRKIAIGLERNEAGNSLTKPH